MFVTGIILFCTKYYFVNFCVWIIIGKYVLQFWIVLFLVISGTRAIHDWSIIHTWVLWKKRSRTSAVAGCGRVIVFNSLDSIIFLRVRSERVLNLYSQWNFQIKKKKSKLQSRVIWLDTFWPLVYQKIILL